MENILVKCPHCSNLIIINKKILIVKYLDMVYIKKIINKLIHI